MFDNPTTALQLVLFSGHLLLCLCYSHWSFHYDLCHHAFKLCHRSHGKRPLINNTLSMRPMRRVHNSCYSNVLHQAPSGYRSIGSSLSHLVLLSGHLGIWFHTSHLVIYLPDQLNSKENENAHEVLSLSLCHLTKCMNESGRIGTRWIWQIWSLVICFLRHLQFLVVTLGASVSNCPHFTMSWLSYYLTILLLESWSAGVLLLFTSFFVAPQIALNSIENDLQQSS